MTKTNQAFIFIFISSNVTFSKVKIAYCICDVMMCLWECYSAKSKQVSKMKSPVSYSEWHSYSELPADIKGEGMILDI